nr:uncharacterized protein LOC109150044 [Ipomoea batatas]
MSSSRNEKGTEIVRAWDFAETDDWRTNNSERFEANNSRRSDREKACGLGVKSRGCSLYDEGLSEFAESWLPARRASSDGYREKKESSAARRQSIISMRPVGGDYHRLGKVESRRSVFDRLGLNPKAHKRKSIHDRLEVIQVMKDNSSLPESPTKNHCAHSTLLSDEDEETYITLLKEYIDIFALTYKEMTRLDPKRSLVLIRPLELHDVRLPGQMLQDHNLPPRVLDILHRHKLPPRNFLARVFRPVAFSVAIVKQFRGNGISGIGRDPYN